MPSAATLANAASAGVVDGASEQTEQQRTGARHQHRRPPLRRDARAQRVEEDRHEPRATATGSDSRRCHTHLTSSRNRLSSESSRARTSSRRIEESRAEPRQRRGQLARLAGLHDEAPASRVERHAGHRLETDQRGRQAAAVVGAHEHVARTVVHRVADGVVATGGGEPAVDQHDHPLGQALDLVEHVRADDDRAALGAEALEQGDQLHPLHRVGAVQRLVEDEHLRILHQGGGDLAALAHPLAEGVDATIGDVEQADGPQRLVGSVARRDPVEVGDVLDEAPGAEPRRAPPRPRAPAPSGCGRCRSRRGSRPSTRTAPWLTPTRPVIARISVVLPAPFGPSRPVTPGPNEQLSSERATFGPNHTDTSATSTVASGANAGSPARRTAVAGSGGSKVIPALTAPPSDSGAAARRCRR